ncbi:MAG: hypothetical protein F4057_09920 [Acidobacteria bacterium]|nr:hypothetical protein [Acidobacteriota bacterium]MYI75605.1 hypothetical protein [Acidobacteriota bacterium]
MTDGMRSLRAVAALALPALLLPLPAAGQERTPWGDPDLQGLWANDVVTPLERPAGLGERLELTDEELAEAAAANERRRIDTGGPRPGDPILLQGYNQFWMPNRDVSRQTSLVIDPPDGRVPPLTPAGARREALALESSQGVPAQVAEVRRHNDGPEGRSLWERCLTRGVPRLPDFYNNTTLVLQTPDHVVIHMEMIHETRVIPLDRRPHVDAGIRQWHGDPRGRWEGDTLVVETTNFSDKTNFKGSQAGLHLVERFTRAGADALLYEVTVTDADTWTRPWTVRFPIRKSDGPLFEYACHEGNYAMFNTLAGARAEETEDR